MYICILYNNSIKYYRTSFLVSPEPDGSEDTKLCSFSFLKEKEPKRTCVANAPKGPFAYIFLFEETDMINNK